MIHEDIVDTLSGLIANCRDAEQALTRAARRAESTELRSLCAQQAAEYHRAAGELGPYVAQYGGDPDAIAPSPSSPECNFGALSSAGVCAPDDAGLLVDCERGTAAVEARYAGAARDMLPATLRALVVRQWHDVQRHFEELGEVRHRAPFDAW